MRNDQWVAPPIYGNCLSSFCPAFQTHISARPFKNVLRCSPKSPGLVFIFVFYESGYFFPALNPEGSATSLIIDPSLLLYFTECFSNLQCVYLKGTVNRCEAFRKKLTNSRDLLLYLSTIKSTKVSIAAAPRNDTKFWWFLLYYGLYTVQDSAFRVQVTFNRLLLKEKKNQQDLRRNILEKRPMFCWWCLPTPPPPLLQSEVSTFLTFLSKSFSSV